MRGPTFTATLHSKLNPKPVPVVPAVPPLRSVPIVSAVQRSRTDSQGTLAHFGNYRNVEMAAMVSFFRSVKLVRDLGNLGKSGTRERA